MTAPLDTAALALDLLQAQDIELSNRTYSTREALAALLDSIATLTNERDEARAALAEHERHPFAPDKCPACDWSNTGLMNYGTPEQSRWLCHGCAARAIQKADASLALATDRAIEAVTRAEVAERERDAYERVCVVASTLRTFPVPFEQHYELVGAVDELHAWRDASKGSTP